MKTQSNRTRLFLKLTTSACLLYAVSAGFRGNYGIMLGAVSASTGVDYPDVSFVIAIAQLMFGIMQPVFGMAALKKSNSFVLISGCILMTLGFAGIPFCTNKWMLLIFLGVLLSSGTGALSFGIIVGALTPRLGTARAASASGFINAGSGVGNIILAPFIQSLFESVGLKTSMLIFSLLMAALIPVSGWIGKEPGHIDSGSGQSGSDTHTGKMLAKAIRDKNYLYLMFGFFTCGFHMAIIETHLYSQFLSYNIAGSLAAIAFSVYGFASVAGSLISGFLSSRYQMNYIVGSLYGSRCLIIPVFLLLPKTPAVLFGFITLLGLTGAATVTPTSSLVSRLFGAENLGVLFGIVFLSHQFGSFFSSWLGGRSVTATGGYTLIWSISASLSFAAMIVSYRISAKKQNCT